MREEYFIEISAKKNFSNVFKELKQFKELLFFFAWKDLKIKYKQAFLGVLWVILQPALMMMIFTLFSQAIQLKSENIQYPIFALSGLIFWNVFASSVQAAGNSIVSNANVIKKVYFPRILLPASSILVSLFDFLISQILLIIFFIYYQTPINIFIALGSTLVSLLIICMFALGIGLSLASLNVKYRDFKYVIPFLIQLLFFVSPVVYSPSLLGESNWNILYYINPCAGSIDFVRYGFFGSDLKMLHLAISSVSSLFFLISGVIIFTRTQNNFADIA